MPAASLTIYDGSAGTLVDTNIWVDCIDETSRWHDWAVDQLQTRSERSPLPINLIVYTELAGPWANNHCVGRIPGRLRHVA